MAKSTKVKAIIGTLAVAVPFGIDLFQISTNKIPLEMSLVKTAMRTTSISALVTLAQDLIGSVKDHMNLLPPYIQASSFSEGYGKAIIQGSQRQDYRNLNLSMPNIEGARYRC